MTDSQVRLVKTWHEALNNGDVDRLTALSHPEVEVGGPRGSGRGSQLLREWVGRAKIHLQPRRVFHWTDTVVVEQEAVWHTAGEVTGSQRVASVFIVCDDRVASILRYDTLTDALGAAKLDESYEVRSG